MAGVSASLGSAPRRDLFAFGPNAGSCQSSHGWLRSTYRRRATNVSPATKCGHIQRQHPTHSDLRRRIPRNNSGSEDVAHLFGSALANRAPRTGESDDSSNVHRTGQGLYHVQRIGSTGKRVFDAALYHWTSVTPSVFGQLVRSQPKCPFDVGIEASARIVPEGFCQKGKPEKSVVQFCGRIKINPEQRGKFNVPGAFLERFPAGCFKYGLARIPMTGRLVEDSPVVYPLFNTEKAPLSLNQRRNDQMGGPVTLGHGRSSSIRRCRF